MKAFFTESLYNLFALTGIEQVKWMLSDAKRGEKDFDLCVEAMVNVSRRFDYISDEDQQKIISKMMLEDRDYKGLNARVIWKWLDLHKDVYYRGQTHHVESDPKEEDLPSKEKVAEYVRQWQTNLATIGKPVPAVTAEEIRDPYLIEMKQQLGTNINDEMKKLRAQYVRENYDIDGNRLACWSEFEEWIQLKQSV